MKAGVKVINARATTKTTSIESKINFLILLLVVMSLGHVHGASGTSGGEVIISSKLRNGSNGDSEGGLANGSDQKHTQTDNSNSDSDSDSNTRQAVNGLYLIPSLERQVSASGAAEVEKRALKQGAGGIDRDDDHSNIELDRLQENNRYALVSDQPANNYWKQTANIENNNNNDPYNLERLFSRIIFNNNNNNSPLSPSAYRLNEYVRNQIEKKRSVRALQNREDKDYSFIVQPYHQQQQEVATLSQPQQAQHINSMNRFYTNPQQYKQRIANKWMAQKLRDMKVSDNSATYQAANFRAAPLLDFDITDNGKGYSDQLSQVNSRSLNDVVVRRLPYNSIAISSETLPADAAANSREKRRRCKMDPNLGVKNPSFCDTDAYFGAADYSMRDVWDSAGRR